MAAGRSLMAWERTGLALIGFGFTVYKFIESSSQQAHPNTARDVGLLVIAMGVVSILLGCIDYWVYSHQIRKKYGVTMRKFPIVVAALVGGFGVALFAAIIFGFT